MKLFYSPASPFVRKVTATAHECGLADKIEILASSAGPLSRDASVAEHNPSGKVPCLLLDDGRALFDSRVICEYLAHLSGNDTLFPLDERRFDILTLEALGDAMLDAALLCRYEVVLRPPNIRWDAWCDAQMLKIDAALDDLETRWLDLLTSDFHGGALAVACALGYLDFRFADKDWRAGHTHLANWFVEISGRASLQSTRPPI